MPGTPAPSTVTTTRVRKGVRPDTRTGTRAAIVAAAAGLLAEGGSPAVTTRGVAERAGVQAPAIYRLFGDKDGLLEAVAEQVMADFVATKVTQAAAAAEAEVDPLDDLVASWRRQIEFGVANPAVFRLLHDPERTVASPAAQSGRQVLEARVRRLAQAGRLRLPEGEVVDLVHAAGTGAIQVLLETPRDARSPALVEHVLEAVLARILTDAPAGDDAGALTPAVALRALAPRLDVLTRPEQALLVEWLDRVIAEG